MRYDALTQALVRPPCLVRSMLVAVLLVSTNVSGGEGTGSESCSKLPGQVRARDLGISPGIFSPGPLNAITDVAGVRVGHYTLIEGDTIRTGATAILPHGGNLYQEKVPAGLHVANGHGKMAGSTQVEELGEIETPIVLTNTLQIAQGMEAAVSWTLERPGNEAVRSVNAVVGETNDSSLSDIRSRPLSPEQVREAIDNAQAGPVQEGSVGAGAGTVAFGWKGGIGTSSRVLPATLGGYTVGVLVQSNYGGTLNIDGDRVGERLDQFYLRDQMLERNEGSIMMVVATDAPLSDRNLRRLARRAAVGLARTGAAFANGSGDYAIAFSTAESVRRTPAQRTGLATYQELANDRVSPLFMAAAEATEEAIYNSMFMATEVSSRDTISGEHRTVRKFPVEKLRVCNDR